MSHISKYKMKIKDRNTLKATLGKNNIKFRENCTVKMFGSNKVEAELAFKLPGWKYECAITKDGEIMFDHWGSKSNTFEQLGKVIQLYNKDAIIAKAFGVTKNFWEEKCEEGIKLVLEY